MGELPDPPDNKKLFNLFTTHLTDNDIATLCFYMEIQYDDLAGDNRQRRLIELIDLAQRQGDKAKVTLWHNFIEMYPNVINTTFDDGLETELDKQSLADRLSDKNRQKKEQGQKLSLDKQKQSIFSSRSLPEVDLSDSYLSELDFSTFFMKSAVFNGAHLFEIKFKKTKLQNSSFIRTQLFNVDFEQANFANAKLMYAMLDEVDFSNSSFEKANFTGTHMTSPIFCHSEGIGSDFSNCVLIKANFLGADLTSSDFSGANLKGASFKSATLRNVIFDKTDLTEVVFEEADLRGASFTNAKMPKAILLNAQISGNELSNILDMAGAILPGGEISQDAKPDIIILNLTNYVDNKTQEEIESLLLKDFPGRQLYWENIDASDFESFEQNLDGIMENNPFWQTSQIMMIPNLNQQDSLASLVYIYRRIKYFPQTINLEIPKGLSEDHIEMNFINLQAIYNKSIEPLEQDSQF